MKTEEPTPRAPGASSELARLLAWRGPRGEGPALGRWLVAVAFAALVAYGLWPFEPVLGLAPPALLAAVALPAMQEGLRRGRRSARFRATRRWLEPLCVAFFFGAFAWSVFGFVFKNDVPIDSNDHHIMISRAELFARSLLEGRLRRWTHLLQGGDALVDLYPVFANYVTTAFYAVWPKGAPFVRVYSFVVVAAWWLRGVAAYHLARRFAGAPVAFALALASVLEVGDDVWDGVWHGTLYWGMIHNNIALSIAAFAAACQVDLARRLSSTRVAACALTLALTAYAHPLGLLYAGVSTGAFALAAVASPGRPRRGLWVVAASGAGALSAAFWFVPYTKNLRELGFHYAIPGERYQSLGQGLLDGKLPTSSFTAFLGFGLIAVTCAVTSRRLAVKATALCALLFWMLALTPLLVQTRFYDYVPSFLDGQQRRMLTVLKTAAIPPLAWALARATAHLQAPGSLRPRPVLGRALVLLLLALGPGRAVAYGVSHAVAEVGRQVPVGPDGKRAQKTETDPDYDEVFAWLKQQRAEDPSPTPWRAALHWASHRKHAAWTEGDRTGVPIVDFIAVSANFLGIRPREKTAAGYRDWNIRYAITDHGSPPWAGMVERFKKGTYHVWEVPEYDDRYVLAPPGATVSGLRFEGDSVHFTLDGMPEGGAEVQIRCAWFPRWRAAQGGAELPVLRRPPRPEAVAKQDQLVVRARNGVVTLTCDGAMPGALQGAALSALGLGLGAIVVGRRRRLRIEGALRHAARRGEAAAAAIAARGRAAFAPPAPRWRAPLAVAALGAALVALHFRGTRRLRYPVLPGQGLSVAALDAEGRRRACPANWWNNTFQCPAGVTDASVEPWLGHGTVIGESGEDPPFWPAVRLSAKEAKRPIELRFHTVRFGRKAVWLEMSTWGKFTLHGSVGGVPFEARPVDGVTSVSLDVPPGARAVGDLVLVFTPEIVNASVDLRGGAR
ncbi:MAG TPA: hypothetical protein VFS43_48065 [Polyangiaceae bacterium]|nr:hypothetical protein [Polyangiaceae bacterium]